jgi:hypothetical protein
VFVSHSATVNVLPFGGGHHGDAGHHLPQGLQASRIWTEWAILAYNADTLVVRER